MNFRTILPMITLLFIVSQKFGDAFTIKFTTELKQENFPTEETHYLTCYNDGQIRDARLQKNSMEKMFQTIQNKNHCEMEESFLCVWLRDSQYCIGTMNSCTAVSSGGSGYICTKTIFETRDPQSIDSLTSNDILEVQEAHSINSFAIDEDFLNIRVNGIDATESDETFDMRTSESKASNGSSGVLRRKARQLTACFHPSMQTSSLSFIKYPSSISAKQKCIFGYTLKEGISREMRCKYSENQWKPTGFEECRPFVDCSIELTSSGHLECFTATTENAPLCNITCNHYEDKAGVPQRSYECQIYGGWKPKLPFCATSGTGLDVVPAPRIRVHPVEREPEPEPLKKLPNMAEQKKHFPKSQP